MIALSKAIRNANVSQQELMTIDPTSLTRENRARLIAAKQGLEQTLENLGDMRTASDQEGHTDWEMMY